MKISCRKKVALGSRKEAIIIPVYKNIGSLRALTGKKLDDEIQKILSSDYFNFEEKEIKSFYVVINGKLKRVFLVNVPKEFAEYRYYMELGAKFASILKKDKISSSSLLSFEDICNERRDFGYTKAFIDGVYFGLYSFDVYKSKPDNFEFDELEVITAFTKLKKYIDGETEKIHTVFDNVYLCRDLVNTPPADLTPAIYADTVVELFKDIAVVDVLDEDDIQEKNLNMVYAVGKASSNQPRFVTVEYNGDPSTPKHVALVGKGVIFDSGGTNLKPSGSIETMKQDMAGSAVVLSVTKAIAELGMKVNIKTYVPMVENTIGTCAYRPGDILTAENGKTVEIFNTDAEGRLILADALSTAIKTDPEIVIDVATLTGACVVALGSHCAGLFSNRRFLSKNISDISVDLGEDIWELPLLEAYRERVKSDVADLRNISAQKGEAGSTIAALFLQEFVDNWPWIHLDIAGPAYLESGHPVFGKYASGFGVRLLVDFIERHYCH